MITVLVADTEHGLECQDACTGAWVPVPLGRGKCAVLVGRAGASAVCKHRVRRHDDDWGHRGRVSISLDLYDPLPCVPTTTCPADRDDY